MRTGVGCQLVFGERTETKSRIVTETSMRVRCLRCVMFGVVPGTWYQVQCTQRTSIVPVSSIRNCRVFFAWDLRPGFYCGGFSGSCPGTFRCHVDLMYIGRTCPYNYTCFFTGRKIREIANCIKPCNPTWSFWLVHKGFAAMSSPSRERRQKNQVEELFRQRFPLHCLLRVLPIYRKYTCTSSLYCMFIPGTVAYVPLHVVLKKRDRLDVLLFLFIHLV